jgi:hypothetical protein
MALSAASRKKQIPCSKSKFLAVSAVFFSRRAKMALPEIGRA